MNILLVDNLILPEEGSLAQLDVHPHLGLLALAAVAETQGHRVSIFDPKRLIRSGELKYNSTLYERVCIKLLEHRPQAVGFTTLGCSFLFARNVAALLKRREPDLPILLGGPHATMLHRQILERFPEFDIVVRHEADEIFPAVLDKLELREFDRIPGVSWRVSRGHSGLRYTEGKPMVGELDSLPIASYDHYPIADLGLKLLRIEAGRGCPFNCTFCSTAGFFQRSYRLKSPERLVKELDILNIRYGFSNFKLDHDMFTVNRRKVMDFCEAVKDRGYRWSASARVDCVNEELLGKMAEAGCDALYFGIESGSKRMQRISQKRLDLDLVHPMLDIAHNLGIETTASFITGYPEESEQDQNATLDMLGRCFSASCLPQLHILTPEPGTPMFEQHGKHLEYDGYGGPYNTALLNTDDKDLVFKNPDIFQNYYYYPVKMPRFRHVFAVIAVDIFRRAGPVIMKYILRVYDNKLSNLIRELRLFAEASAPNAWPDSDMVQFYISSKFGVNHHLTSLFRYALRANVPGGNKDPSPQLSGDDLDLNQRYELSPNIHVLRDLHDCGLLLKKITLLPHSPQLLDEKLAGERGLYLLNTAVDNSTLVLINPGIEAILGMFVVPRTCREVTDMVCKASRLQTLEISFFEDLVRAGIIVASHAASDQSKPIGEARQFDTAEA